MHIQFSFFQGLQQLIVNDSIERTPEQELTVVSRKQQLGRKRDDVDDDGDDDRISKSRKGKAKATPKIPAKSDAVPVGVSGDQVGAVSQERGRGRGRGRAAKPAKGIGRGVAGAAKPDGGGEEGDAAKLAKHGGKGGAVNAGGKRDGAKRGGKGGTPKPEEGQNKVAGKVVQKVAKEVAQTVARKMSEKVVLDARRGAKGGAAQTGGEDGTPKLAKTPANKAAKTAANVGEVGNGGAAEPAARPANEPKGGAKVGGKVVAAVDAEVFTYDSQVEERVLANREPSFQAYNDYNLVRAEIFTGGLPGLVEAARKHFEPLGLDLPVHVTVNRESYTVLEGYWKEGNLGVRERNKDENNKRKGHGRLPFSMEREAGDRPTNNIHLVRYFALLAVPCIDMSNTFMALQGLLRAIAHLVCNI